MDARPLDEALRRACGAKHRELPESYASKPNVEAVWMVTLEFALSPGGPLKRPKGIGGEGKLDRMIKKDLKYFPSGPPKYGFKWGVREGSDTRKVYAFLKELLLGRKLVVPVLTRLRICHPNSIHV